MSALGLAALLAATAAAVGTVLARSLEGGLDDVFERRVVPVRHLKAVSDAFAITIVDTVHKVCARRLSQSRGAIAIRGGLDDVDVSWAALRATPEAFDLSRAEDTQNLLAPALSAAQVALGLMERGDLDALERFRVDAMYTAIDPLTWRLNDLVQEEVRKTDASVRDARRRILRIRTGVTALLVLAGTLAFGSGLVVSRRLATSVRAIDQVVRSVAAGDLSPRIALPGGDELAHTAANIDRMIDALQQSRRDLEAQSAKLEVVAREANVANTAKSLFLSSISHELRTPLNVILGYAQLMRRRSRADRFDDQAVERITQAGTHLLGLIEDVLSISGIEAGTLPLRVAPASVRSLVGTLDAMFAPIADAKGIALRMHVRDDVPDWVRIDQGRLRQVLVNLVGNAVKFTKAGSVSLDVRAEGGRLFCTVSDTGPGIAAEDAPEIFQTFFQGKEGRGAGEGAGLGLFISRSLVLRMGGDMTFESEWGRGTVFTFQVDAPETAPDGAPSGTVRAPALAPGATVGPMLVVDDRKANREVLSCALSSMGFSVEEAASGEEALTLLDRRSYALLWIDVRMPGMSGAELVSRLRERERARGRRVTRAVAITASAIDLDLDAARSMGFDALVLKPFRIESLVSTIQAQIGAPIVEQAPVEPAVARIRAEDVSALDAGTRGAMRDALILGDGAAALAAMGPFAETDVGKRLRATIERFEFDPLLAMLGDQP